jgi:hypothetical protein
MPKTLQPEEAFQIVAGFNVTDEKGNEKRFDVGKKKPNFVTEKDFTPKQWKSLVEMGAVVPFEQLEDEE